MPRHDSFGVIRQPFNYVSGGEDRLEFICCVGGQQPQIQEVWTFAEDGITRKVHPTTRIDIGTFSGDCFHTDYSTEEGHRVSIYGRKSINGSVEWLRIPCHSCDDGPPWTDNLLCPSPIWGDGVRVGAWYWGIQPGIRFGVVSVLWRRAVPARVAYLTWSPEN